MTHKDIYTKFMIEYDKANVTSSYPSLTEYEVATVLDKAYYALIAQKLTGNNIRRTGFESDIKSVEDLRPLLVRETKEFELSDDIISNLAYTSIPTNSLYLIDVILSYSTVNNKTTQIYTAISSDGISFEELKSESYYFRLSLPFDFKGNADDYILQYTGDVEQFTRYKSTGVNRPGESSLGQPGGTSLELLKEDLFNGNSVYVTTIPSAKKGDRFVLQKISDDSTVPMDGIISRSLPAKQVNHDIAEKFYASAYNLPWIKLPVFYIEDNTIFVVFDPINIPQLSDSSVMYIKKPNKFAKDDITPKDEEQSRSYFSVKDKSSNDITSTIPEYQFECNDSMAEELISLAIAFALENVESQRLTTKLNMRGLEA